MNKQKFEKLDKVKELLDELKMTEFIAPLLWILDKKHLIFTENM